MIDDNKSVVTSLVAEKDIAANEVKKDSAKKNFAKKNTGQNRRKSRELVLKAVYRGMLNQSELGPIFRDMAEDPEYNKADEDLL